MKHPASRIILALALIATIGVARAHEHKAPHKGTLIEFGEEFAHLELVIDSASGKISAWVLDGEAEKAVRVAQAEIEIKVTKAEKPGTGPAEAFSVTVKAVASALTGEKVGDTSEFSGQSDKLKDLKVFDAVVAEITVKGKPFKDTKFNFPKGNE